MIEIHVKQYHICRYYSQSHTITLLVNYSKFRVMIGAQRSCHILKKEMVAY